ncbi:hypothetical protein [Sinomonas sp. G460-2]|uniref:hypothetical protein n=1 Tax=Sinomonas sp. G460-2 TaxID=3393464 RepID=UPI0039EF21F6
MGLSLAGTACGSYFDGDQWVGVTVTNNTSESVTLETHPTRLLSTGQSTLIPVDSNSNPQALRVQGPDGRVLGCLTFLFHSTSNEKRSVRVSDVTACDENIPSFAG